MYCTRACLTNGPIRFAYGTSAGPAAAGEGTTEPCKAQKPAF
jgi:hypothetical protein